MKTHVAYLKAVLRHKWFVFLACLEMGVPIASAIVHDWDKFFPRMWLPYANYFYGPSSRDRNNNPQLGETLAFDVAWNGHQKLQKHHWQYWVLLKDDGGVYPLPMPDRHRREMVADWMGAGRAYVKNWTPSEPLNWYEKNKTRIQLHAETREWVEEELNRFAQLHMLREIKANL